MDEDGVINQYKLLLRTPFFLDMYHDLECPEPIQSMSRGWSANPKAISTKRTSPVAKQGRITLTDGGACGKWSGIQSSNST